MAALRLAGSWLRVLGRASWLVARAGRGAGLDLFERDPFAERRAVEALGTYFWGPLPVLALLSALVGVVAGTIAAHALALYHVELVIEPLVVRTLCRDVVPILIGLFAVGRVSVELASRLAGAALAREVDALETLGHDPVRYFLSPALAAVLIAVPLHSVIAAACANLAAAWVIDFSAQTSFATYAGLLDGAAARALVTGIVKGGLFTLIAFAVGIVVGASDARGPADVGIRATRAFTAGLLCLFAAATLWAVLA